MKKFLLSILCLASLGFSQIIQTQIHSRGPVGCKLVTFTSLNKTAGYVISPDSGTTWRVYVDTSASGQAGEYKRIDNTSDSGRSNPVLVQGDATGRYLPERNPLLVFSTKGSAANLDSNGIQLKVFRRFDMPYKTAPRTASTYSYPGKNGAGMVDTVAATSNGGLANVKVTHFGEVSPHGTYWRIRPDRIAATGKVVTDTSKFDSIWVVF